MDERGANIDIVFRNGLKDYEVLPPPEVWDNIHPVIKRRQRPVILLRAAAAIAIVLTLSFAAYRLTREISTPLDNSVMALNDETASSGITSSSDLPVNVTVKEAGPVRISPEMLIEDIQDNVIQVNNERVASPMAAFLPETNILSKTSADLIREPLLASLISGQNITFEISKPDQLYFPDNTSIKSADRWSIGAMASPTYYSNFSAGNSDISKQLSASEQPLVSYSGGVAFTFKINKRFSIQSGLYYSSLGQEVNGINSFSGFQKYDYTKGDHNFEVLTTNGTIYTDNADVFLSADGLSERIQTNYTSDVFDPEKASLQYINSTMRQNFSYLELPIILRYKVVDKTIDINIVGGVSYNLLVSNTAYTMVDGGKYPIGKTEGLNPISLSSSLGMGMEYNFSENLSLNLEPTFRYYLNPFNEVTGSRSHPYSFGIFSGVSYKF
jgi:hypothetical protein